MGCSKSKEVHNISVNGANRKLQESLQGLDVVRISSSASSSLGSSLGREGSSSHSSSAPHTPEDRSQAQRLSTPGGIPTALNDIPINDLGESLDARKRGSTLAGTSLSSAKSSDSTDSGIYDLDDDYSFVITENSPPELVKRVELDFTPIENMDLTITGKACPRMLSGYQKSRQEEAAILENLRDEGLISTSRQRSGGGVSFDIVEMTPKVESAGSTKLNPKDYFPKVYKDHLDAQRNRFAVGSHTSHTVQRKLHEAEERRNAELEAKRQKMTELARASGSERKVEQLKQKRDQRTDAALEKREAHLKELRDKLRAKNQKVLQVKLKKMINGPPVPIPMGTGNPFVSARPADDFFDM